MTDGTGDISAIVDRPYPAPPPQNCQQWREFAEKPWPERPTVPTPAEFGVMPKSQRDRNRKERMAYHWAMAPIDTAPVAAITAPLLKQANNCLRMSAGSTRPGAIIDGLGFLGKTTLLLELGREYEKLRRKQMRDLTGQDEFMPNGYRFVPVVFISLSGEVNLKSLDLLFAHFYQIPLRKGASQGEIAQAVKKYFMMCGTSLVLVDEIHFLRLGDPDDRKEAQKAAQRVNNHLKELANASSSMWVFAGINVKGTKLLVEGEVGATNRSSQTRRRFALKEFNPFPLETDKNLQVQQRQLQDWLDVLVTFESKLCLVDHKTGTLERWGHYLHDRTQGAIGPLRTLLCTAANNAILRSTERITKTLLDEVQLDYGSEEDFERLQRGRTARQTSETNKSSPARQRSRRRPEKDVEPPSEHRAPSQASTARVDAK